MSDNTRHAAEPASFKPSPELKRLTDACDNRLKSITACVQRELGAQSLKYLLKSQARLINDLEAGLDR